MLAQVMMNLLFVVSLAGVLLYVMKKWKQPGGRASSLIKTLSMLSLGTKEKILLLEVQGERILVGVTPTQMNLLKEFNRAGSPSLTVMEESAFGEVFRNKSTAAGESL